MKVVNLQVNLTLSNFTNSNQDKSIEKSFSMIYHFKIKVMNLQVN